MNTLEIRFEMDRLAKDSASCRPIPTPDVIVDGRSMLERFTLDLRELVASTHANGEYWIFTCGCGEPGCAGIGNPIVVQHGADMVYWLVPAPIRQPRSDEPRNVEFTFERRSYFFVVKAALERALRMSDEVNDEVDLGPHGFTVAELRSLAVEPIWN